MRGTVYIKEYVKRMGVVLGGFVFFYGLAFDSGGALLVSMLLVLLSVAMYQL